MKHLGLKEFVHWYFRNDLDVETNIWKIFIENAWTETIIYQDPPYQVEFIILKPFIQVSRHCHPNVSTRDVHLTGKGEAWIGNRLMPQSDDTAPLLSPTRQLPLPAGVPHWGFATTTTLVLSCQLWHNGVTPTFLANDWREV